MDSRGSKRAGGRCSAASLSGVDSGLAERNGAGVGERSDTKGTAWKRSRSARVPQRATRIREAGYHASERARTPPGKIRGRVGSTRGSSAYV